MWGRLCTSSVGMSHICRTLKLGIKLLIACKINRNMAPMYFKMYFNEQNSSHIDQFSLIDTRVSGENFLRILFTIMF